MITSSEWVNASDIVIGPRLRQDLGDIAGLAASIETHGLLHPLTIDAETNLIAGERRLKAMQKLGWTSVEVRRWESLSEPERRELELEENLQRKDLTSTERSRNLVELALVAEEVDRETGELLQPGLTESVRPQNRPQLGSSTRVAERLGIPRTTINEAKKHVVAGEKYPFLQQAGWGQYNAMEAADVLDHLPEEDREPIARLIDQPGIPPIVALPALKNAVAATKPERRRIVELAQSADERDRTLALTKLTAQPQMPDPRATLLTSALKEIARCISVYPDDPEVPALQTIATSIKDVIQSIEERHTNRADSAA